MEAQLLFYQWTTALLGLACFWWMVAFGVLLFMSPRYKRGRQ